MMMGIPDLIEISNAFDATTINTAEQTESTDISSSGLLPNDILAGRDGKPMRELVGDDHPGNVAFKQVVEENLQRYQRLSRNRRAEVVRDVMECLMNDRGCRFVRLDKATGHVTVLNERQIRDKVSFALRQAARRLKKSTEPSTATSKPKMPKRARASSDQTIHSQQSWMSYSSSTMGSSSRSLDTRTTATTIDSNAAAVGNDHQHELEYDPFDALWTATSEAVEEATRTVVTATAIPQRQAISSTRTTSGSSLDNPVGALLCFPEIDSTDSWNRSTTTTTTTTTATGGGAPILFEHVSDPSHLNFDDYMRI